MYIAACIHGLMGCANENDGIDLRSSSVKNDERREDNVRSRKSC